MDEDSTLSIGEIEELMRSYYLYDWHRVYDRGLQEVLRLILERHQDEVKVLSEQVQRLKQQLSQREGSS